MRTGQLAFFIAVVLCIWAGMHGYVFGRFSSLPWIRTHISSRALWLAAACGFASFPLARLLGSWRVPGLAPALEFVADNWLGTLFLLFVCFAVTDILTLAGLLFRSRVPLIRSWAALAAISLSVLAFVQGMRPPLVRNYEVALPGLPPERDGLRLVQLSDLHLGSVLGRNWLERLTMRVNQLRPDLLVLSGDVVDGNIPRVTPLVGALQKLQAPLGVWAVSGNHEYYAGLDRSLDLFETAGFRVLRDRSAQVVPGLVLAGVDDLTARAQFGNQDDAVEKALGQRPPGATILLSHTPWQVGKAAGLGAGLVLSGHTHDGQIWPFKYLVQLRYPFMAGRYEVNGTTLLVSRGTGTWGPRMRLWRRSEIVQVLLRSAPPKPR